MLKNWIILLLLGFGLLSQEPGLAAQKKHAKKQSIQASTKQKKLSTTASKTKLHATKGSKKKGAKKNKRRRSKHAVFVGIKNPAPLKLIAENKEKMRVSDSLHQSTILLNSKDIEEGYFASLFTNQKKAASFQTLEGTAAVFKSVSGWEDKKFYILTNQLPVGTIVRITTADLKSICAKVINALPEVGNSIQYRLSDAAAAILGITNKTFQISVTY
ncbi:MAG: hypothetical protein NTY43_02730 [Bacteroidetes bacterium]|jgi:hypothetical protein|nr:hypothetical protein [Bacteroidota bacterium]